MCANNAPTGIGFYDRHGVHALLGEVAVDHPSIAHFLGQCAGPPPRDFAPGDRALAHERVIGGRDQNVLLAV